VTTLGTNSNAFTPMVQADLVAAVTSELALGARVSVFATSSGGNLADSAHLVHRNLTDADGAIVISPDTKPHYLLFRFPNQTF
jgi:alpha-beta hydrolase superfamily lysophospholipase